MKKLFVPTPGSQPDNTININNIVAINPIGTIHVGNISILLAPRTERTSLHGKGIYVGNKIALSGKGLRPELVEDDGAICLVFVKGPMD